MLIYDVLIMCNLNLLFQVICENLVKSNQALINAHPSLVSIVMQHFSHAPPSNTLNNKKMQNPIETYEGLLNFAPLGKLITTTFDREHIERKVSKYR